jgi:hypothetical protein
MRRRLSVMPPAARALGVRHGVAARARAILAAGLTGALACSTAACTDPRTTTITPPGSAATGPVPSAPSATAVAPAAPAIIDAGVDGDAGYAGPWIGATVLHAAILSEMDWPGDKRGDSDGKSIRLGYLRYGEKVPVIPEAHPKPNCPEGWYELVSGGFMCAKYATLDMDHPKFKLAKPPDLDAELPYVYGINVANGTPLYRSIPSRKERLKLEPWLTGRPKKPKPEDDAANPYGAANDIGASVTPDAGSPAIGENAGDSGTEPPWWEKEPADGGPMAVTLEDLEESGGPIARRMVKGFFLSLDHQFDAAGTTWWKTVDNFTAPSDRILIAKPATEFHGVWLGRDAATYPTKNTVAGRIDKLPIAFVLHGSKHWSLDATKKHATVIEGPQLDRFDAVGLTGEKARVAGVEYWESTDGFWLRTVDFAPTAPGPAPQSLGEHEKWIDVNLKTQTLVAFEGTTPVYATLISSGRAEHETTPGSFRIREKHIAATMDGDAATAADGPYSIQDVPYIQYFNGSYALHGAFWHASFGNVKSHGCVNLAPWDAKALFGWTEPQLPEGWHAAWATKEHPGTRVVVHERGPGTCQAPDAQAPQCPPLP